MTTEEQRAQRTRLLAHCTWLTIERVERLRLEWRLFARIRDDGTIYVQVPRGWCLMVAPSLGAGIEAGLEMLILQSGGVGSEGDALRFN